MEDKFSNILFAKSKLICQRRNVIILKIFQQMIEVTFKSFIDEYLDNLNQPSCIPTCVEEICGGCNIYIFYPLVFQGHKKLSSKTSKKSLKKGLILYLYGMTALNPWTVFQISWALLECALTSWMCAKKVSEPLDIKNKTAFQGELMLMNCLLLCF